MHEAIPAAPPVANPHTYKLETIPTGYRVWKDTIFLLAVITTKDYRGLVRNGVGIFEPMVQDGWSIHFTSPAMSLDDLKAVTAILPTTPD